MALLDRLERAFGRWALPGVSLYLVIGQVGIYLLEVMSKLDPAPLLLVPEYALHGQPWRLVTFLFIPPSAYSILIVFAWWMFYLMGNALEAYWGAFRYNVFLLLGYVLTVGLAFLQPFSVVSNGFLAGSVFLAFAYLNPEFEILMFFILPVKIRWLALLAWAYYAASFVLGSWGSRLAILAAVGNFFIFFGRDLWLNAGVVARRRRLSNASRAERSATQDEPRHRCRICGKTDRTDPQLDFRYCSKCAGAQCYCPEHIFNHEHIRGEDGSAPES